MLLLGGSVWAVVNACGLAHFGNLSRRKNNGGVASAEVDSS